MSDKLNLELVRKFLASQNLGVLATVTSNGLPESSVIGFAENDDFEILFGTFDHSRKAHNLKTNPRVALSVGWDRGITVQYEGEAQELTANDIEDCKRTILTKIPTAAKFVSAPQEKFYKIVPKWIRYSDWSHDPVEKFEIKF